MHIRKKTEEELKADKNMVEKDIAMGVVSGNLYDNLSSEKYAEFLRKSKKLNYQRAAFEKEWTLALRITEHKVHKHSNSLKKDYIVSKVVVEMGDYKRYLHLHNKIEKWEIKNLKLLIESNEGSSEVTIPDADKNGLLRYIVEGKPPIDFDCQSFIHRMRDVKMRPNIENFGILASKRLMEKCDIEHLKPWDCICMFDRVSKNKYKKSWNCICKFDNLTNKYGVYNGVQHFAYYLWKWLFISKLWVKGCIAITTLEELNDLYSTKELAKMTPNPDHEDVKNYTPQT